MRTHRVWLLLFILLLLPCEYSAQARVLLKPNGRGAMPLRLKALKADVKIEKQFATTTTVMTFGNEVSQRIEADFLYSAPPRAVVTYFAYWYGNEKVVARVVEKERAREIYQHITSRMRDPALIEMIGKNTFRARIFPIMPNADLRVEMHTVEMLPSTKTGCEYSLPLKPEVAGKGTLEDLNVSVRVAPDAAISGVGNNLALPVAREASGAWTMRLQQKNFLPSQDLRVGLRLAKAPLRASIFAAPSGGRDGFFALALTPSRDVARPKLRIEGADVYDVMPKQLPPLKAGRETLVVGRYRAASTRSAARVVLGGELQSALVFGNARRDNNLATKLWAAERIELLSASTRAASRAQVVALSQRFTLPSKFTSWLAIPEEERARYKTEKARADMSYFARLYGNEVRAGRRNSRVARDARRRLGEAGKSIGANSNEELAQQLGQIAVEWSYQRRPKDERGLRALQREIEGLAAAVPRAYRVRVLASMADARRSVYDSRLRKMAIEWTQLVATNKAQTPQARRLQEQVRQLEGRIGQQSAYLGSGLQEKLSRVANLWAQEKHSANPNVSRVASLDAEIERVAKALALFKNKPYIMVTTAKQARHSSEVNLLSPQLRTLSQQIVQEEKAFSPNEEKLADLREQARKIAASGELSAEAAKEDALGSWSWNDWNFAYSWAVEKLSERPDAKKLAYYQKLVEEATEVRARHNGGNNFVGTQGAADVLKSAENAVKLQRIGLFAQEQMQELAKAQPDETVIAQFDEQIATLREQIAQDSSSQALVDSTLRNARAKALEAVLEKLRAEHDKPKPDAQLVAQLEARVLALQEFDSYYENYYPHNARPKVAPKTFAKWRTERIAVRAQGRKTQTQLEKAQVAQRQTLQREREHLAARENELKLRMGDPLIMIDAPADAQQVVAVLPDGTVKNLRYEAAAKRWEARFDVPEYSQGGAHEIVILVLQRDGTRRRLSMRYNVDVKAPRGSGTARDVSANGKTKWRLEVRGERDTARVAALLPWNERAELEPSAQDKTLFFAVVTPPPGFTQAPRVTFVLTDRAHNRSQITLDLGR